jgi:Acetyltransferase (isoleucine patch superfamily)
MSRVRKLIKIIFLKFKYGKSLDISFKIGIRRGINININGGHIIINKGVFLNNYCSINSQNLIEIGENTLLGENVKIYDHNHLYRDKNKTIKEQGFSKEAIHIGKNCWIGSNVTILKGVTIGDNVVIGANVLVYKSIKSNSIVKMKANIIVEDY